MSGYKMNIGSEAESQKVQELFFELGYAWMSGDTNPINSSSPYIYTSEDMELWCGDYHATYNETNKKKLTIPQLKDMVVLKRNDVADANYTYCGKPVLKLDTQDYRVWNNLDKCWAMNLGSDTDLRNGLKPIAKAETVMKEYLVNYNGKYKLEQLHNPIHGAIEIPEGAEKYIQGIKYPERFGFLKGNKFWDDEWIGHGDDRDEYSIVWSRHTQPEELPFVDGLDKVEKDTKYIRENYPNGFPLKDDQVNRPSHYASGAVECIDAIESSMTKEAFAGYLKGNVQKYMWRYENKGGVESLQKAQWYLNRLILLQSA